MEKQILKLTGNSKNYYDNLLYFFNTLKNTGFIKNFSECGFFCELSQKKNIFPIYDFFLKNEPYSRTGASANAGAARKRPARKAAETMIFESARAVTSI